MVKKGGSLIRNISRASLTLTANCILRVGHLAVSVE